ncbi:hypothetical protein [Kribbella sp. NPDC000426]|uniref:hypothetical protein n=1 Tax=Kribbella sp. NPDC000426 TaxID=3154255 RepID=UPI00332DBDC6
MRSNVHDTDLESLARKRFRSSSTNEDHAQLEISGFGVRVPGGAQKPRSQRGLGFFMPAGHLLFDAFSRHVSLADRMCGLHLVVTVRHITRVRDMSDSPTSATAER